MTSALDPASIEAVGRLFDQSWYAARYPEVGASGLSPLAYYLEVGDAAGHWPHELFDPAHYADQLPELPTEGGVRFGHYATVGGRDGADPHPLFHSQHYLDQCSDAIQPGQTGLAHYLAEGEARGWTPNPVFLPSFYLAAHPDLVGVSCLLAHYVQSGAREGRAPNPLFAPDFYYEGVRGEVSGVGEILAHYLASGEVNGFRPHPLFDPVYYAAGVEGLAPGKGKSLAHYSEHGGLPGAAPHPLFDPRYFAQQLKAGLPPGETLLAYYLGSGERQGLKPNPLFDPLFYAEHGEIGDASELEHYVRHGGDADLSPISLFDSRWVREQLPLSERRKGTPLAHYLESGGSLEKGPHPLFDASWYASEYLGADASEFDAFVHFVEEGAASGSDPNPLFYSAWYRDFYAEHFARETPSITHYLKIGHVRGLSPNPLFNPDYYLAQAGVDLSPGETALTHYFRTGMKRQYPPSELFWFCLQFFRSKTGQRDRRDGNPAAGYLMDKFSDFFSPDAEIEINLPAVHTPDVSIIIPVYGQISYTLACLRSISRAENEATFEIIIVDDHSPISEFRPLVEIENLRIKRNAKNVGFVHSCNRGASEARGRDLVFLNNDTLVTDRWLDRLIETREPFPSAGLVGSQLVFPDGKLQEAGSIVWSDGSAHNYGSGDDPSDPRYSFARKSDYVSAASVLIDREFFESLEGFEEVYAPAFYEDTDLAFKVRNAGKEVIYQPGSVVIHFGGASHGRDTDSGLKQHQVFNRSTFRERWESALEAQPVRGSRVDSAATSRGESHVLVIDATMLTPDQDAGSLRMFNLIKVLSGMGYVATFIPNDLSCDEEGIDLLSRSGIQVISSPHYQSIERFLQSSGAQFDLVIVSRPDSAENCLDMARLYCPKALILYDTVDLHFLRREREIALTGSSTTAPSISEKELRACSRADAAITVSDYDRSRLLEKIPGATVHVVSLIDEVRHLSQSFDERDGLLFIGGFRHPPNVDAVVWFLDEVFPILSDWIPGIRFHIVGPDPPEEIRNRASETVVVEGYLESIEAQYANRRVSVAPIRYGSGVKGKINQAMAYGLPCVATPEAVEGMDLDLQEEILVAASAQDFAESVAELYESETLWLDLSRKSTRSIERSYSPAVAEEKMRQLLEAHGRTPPLDEST
jgi:GT2 family glycosyltransferase/glycosyltransferase involved in cell wall biosynthesis